MSDVMFTANRLDDGVVIWLTRALCWSEASTQAAVFSDDGAEAARDAVAAACQRNFIVAAYEVAVDGRADTSMRERIRAGRGPTITPPQDNRPCVPWPVKGD
jgi:hypothetical protein